MKIEDIQQEIVEEFSILEDWVQRYEHLIFLGKGLDRLPAEAKDPDHLIKGCQSQVWLLPEYSDGKMVFRADSDSVLTKGMIALLVRTFSQQPPEEIMKANIDFIDQIGLREHLSPTRANGLLSMVKEIKLRALENAQSEKT